MKLIKSFFLVLLFMTSGPGWAQDSPDVIAQFRRTVFTLQQEMLELKNQIDRQERELIAQKEELSLQVERLNGENANMRKHLLEMDSLIFQMEDRLAASSLVKLDKQLQNLRKFNQAVILDNINQFDQSEKLLLEVLNQPESSLPKDLLILLLAQQKKRQQQYDESISYYSTLLAEFFGSAYFSQAIFEMSEIMEDSGKPDQQITLLAQLSSLSETDPYSIKAREKLKLLGAEKLFEEEVIKPDATADVKDEKLATIAPDATSDATTDVQTELESENTEAVAVPVKTDPSSDVSTDIEKQVNVKEKSDAISPTKTQTPEQLAPDTEDPASEKITLESEAQEIQPEPDTTPDTQPEDPTG